MENARTWRGCKGGRSEKPPQAPAPAANAPCKGDTAKDRTPLLGLLCSSSGLPGTEAGALSAQHGREKEERNEALQVPEWLISIPSSATNSWHGTPTFHSSSTQQELPTSSTRALTRATSHKQCPSHTRRGTSWPALLTNGEAGQCHTLTLNPSPEATFPFLGSKNPPEKLRSQRMRLDLKHLIPNKDTRQKGNVLSTGGCSPEQHEDRGAMVQHPPEKG